MFGAPRSRSRGFATAARLSPPVRSSSFGAPLARRALTRLARPLATHPIAPLLEAATRALLEVETTPVDFCSSQRRADTSCERFVLARARDDARRRCRNVRSPKRPAASHAVPSWSSRSTRPPCGGVPRVGREARDKARRTNRSTLLVLLSSTRVAERTPREVWRTSRSARRPEIFVQRRPAKGGVFEKIEVPSTASESEHAVKAHAPPRVRTLLPFTPPNPHGFRGHCSREQRLCVHSAMPRPDEPSTAG